MDGMIRMSVLHNNLFTLNLKNHSIDGLYAITSGLISTISTFNNKPVIFADDSYHKLADELINRVDELGLKNKNHTKTALLIIDRSFDILTPIKHGWTYSSLINEILSYDLNKATIRKK